MSDTPAVNRDSARRSRVSRGGKSNSTAQRRPRGWKRNQNGPEGPNQGEDDDDDDEEFDESKQCLICAEKITYAALSPCNHITCHVCTFRQRALYEKKACLVCRTENEELIFTEQPQRHFPDFSSKDIVATNEKFQIKFTASYVEKDTLALLDNACPICHTVLPSFKELSEHTKSEHNKHYCYVCSNNKKAFVSELTTYTYKQLQKHHSEGDQKGFKGHPECKYCRGKRFYSEDELNIHIRDKHERCHICDQDHPKTADYFKNYDHLYTHFKTDHYVCSIPSCVERRFVVFREELDLTAHMLKEHGGLTGSNGKVVIGSSSRQFQSSLSTFSSNGSSGSSNTRRRNQLQSSDDVSDSYDIKKMRLEERAKHYLNYNTSAVKQFTEINASYKSKNISARELLDSYKNMFKDIQDSDLSILLYELSELFSTTSQQYKDLITISAEYEGSIQPRDQYPVLGGSNSSSSSSLHSWGGSATPRPKPSEQFPALPKPKKSTTPQVNPKQPIRYTTVIKKPQSGSYSNININSGQAPTNYRPNYLSNVHKAPSISSLPPLGAKSRSSSALPSRSSSPISRVATPPQLNDSKFPTLEKKSNKKVIPRVNPVNLDPGDWGGTKSENQEPQTEAESIIMDKRKQKMKKKQDKVLFKY